MEDGYIDDILKTNYDYLKIDGESISKSLNLYVCNNLRNNKISLPNKDADTFVSVQDVLKGKKVVYFFSASACSNCVSAQIMKLHKLISRIGKNNIVLITDYLRTDIVANLLKNGITISTYETKGKDMGIFFPENKALLLLTVDNNIKTSFIVDIETGKYSDYFYEIAVTFFNKNR